MIWNKQVKENWSMHTAKMSVWHPPTHSSTSNPCQKDSAVSMRGFEAAFHFGTVYTSPTRARSPPTLQAPPLPEKLSVKSPSVCQTGLKRRKKSVCLPLRLVCAGLQPDVCVSPRRRTFIFPAATTARVWAFFPLRLPGGTSVLLFLIV